MTGDTTPQQQAADLIAANLTRAVENPLYYPLMHEQAREVAKELADAVLLCSSPVVQPKDEEGSLRSSEPSAAVPQWAVLRRDDDCIYDDRASAARCMSFLDEDGEDGYRLFEIRAVS